MSEQLEDLHPPSFSQHMAQGHSFRVARWPAPHGARSRPLLFFSGIGANIELLAPFLQEFGSRDVITFDMPGVGGTAPFPRPYRLSTMAKAAREILSGLGVEDVDVMGVSWGGMLAQEFAYRNRQTVKNLVLAATSAGMPMVPGAPLYS
ncbi:alpha/beta fold hydrolase [Novosphingobium sp. G106]|uniref:alpha/beta fold hydrolase n=1 Tax=Novosphingobium sp. G106 TaxID=2849500 RepID=UPI001C2CE33E|nr:alpha/beta fold hydrolase [Novosphingobium sp. G106]MBV1688438.1 alpha/beta fold hydrolase [Novosphingobium sp. G106]